MTVLLLGGLHGDNPLGLFAALGLLDVVSRRLTHRTVTLQWTDEVVPTAILQGADSADQLVELCQADLDRWRRSPVLQWPTDHPLDDLKPSPEQLRRWIDAVMAVYWATGERTDADLLAGLVADGAVAGKGDSKPTHFHFTAGQQRFLRMVRELRDGLSGEDLVEAIFGDWRYQSTLPSLGWDAGGERVYALRAVDPSSEKRRGVPGADWLGFLGLRFFPVTVRRGVLVTTGCSGAWRRGGWFTWPLWSVALDAPTVASLLRDEGIRQLPARDRRALGVTSVLRAPIRHDQGRYGTFGASEPVAASGGGR